MKAVDHLCTTVERPACRASASDVSEVGVAVRCGADRQSVSCPSRYRTSGKVAREPKEETGTNMETREESKPEPDAFALLI